MRKEKTVPGQSEASQHHDLDDQRRIADGIRDMPSGFSLRPHGRDGVVYYKEDSNVLELPYEMDGTKPGILLYIDGLESWVFPSRQPVAPAERDRIRRALEDWARHHRGTVTFVSRSDLIRPWETEDP